MDTKSKQLSVLYDLSKTIVGSGRIEDVCQRILKKVSVLLNVSKASIMKLDPSGHALKIVAALGLPENILKDVSVKVGEGISGRVFKSAKRASNFNFLNRLRFFKIRF